jgi:hypothetical protein
MIYDDFYEYAIINTFRIKENSFSKNILSISRTINEMVNNYLYKIKADSMTNNYLGKTKKEQVIQMLKNAFGMTKQQKQTLYNFIGYSGEMIYA